MSTPGFAIFILLAQVAVLQLVAARRSTGNDINGNYFRDFFSFCFFVTPFYHRRRAQIKNLCSKSSCKRPMTRVGPLSRHCQPFSGPLAANCGFSTLCGVAGSEWVPPRPARPVFLLCGTYNSNRNEAVSLLLLISNKSFSWLSVTLSTKRHIYWHEWSPLQSVFNFFYPFLCRDFFS